MDNNEQKPLVDKKPNFEIMVLKFADSKVPEFKIEPSKDWINFGNRNDYPEYLIYQYNKCGKHRAIINAKTRYILGDGLEGGVWAVNGSTPAEAINDDGETMYDVLKKSIKDVEIHAGFRWLVTVNNVGTVVDIKHVGFNKFRRAKPAEKKDKNGKVMLDAEGNAILNYNTGYFFKNNWFLSDGQNNAKEKAKHYREFTGVPDTEAGEDKLSGTYVFSYNDYGPGSDYYPLPEYIGTANYIDLDIEIGKFHLSAIRNGMLPSKLIQFYTGDPGDEKKKEITKGFRKEFAGSENAGKFVLVFNSNKDKQVTVDDLSASELDKQFELLSKTVLQEILVGHQVVSPMLFGVKTEGQLGGATELRIAYEVFLNTYAKPKQLDLENIINKFGQIMGKGTAYKFKQLDPVGMVLDIKDFSDKLPLEFILEKLGVPEEYRPKPAAPTPGATTPLQTVTDTQKQEVNEHAKNLTGKQNQAMLRIIRQFSKGTITLDAARTLLRTSFGFNDTEIDSLLGIEADDELEMVKHHFEEVQKQKSLAQHRQDEIDAVVKPDLKLNFIKDEKILKTRVMYPVADGAGNVTNRKVSVKRIQKEIETQLQGLQQVISNVYGSN